MSEHDLKHALSALMDGEAGELELHRILRELDDADVRQTWQRLHQVRSAMHQEPFINVDVSTAVRTALDGVEMDKPRQEAAVPARGARWKHWQSVAVAASVTLAVLGGVRFYNQSPSLAPELARQEVQQPATRVPAAAPYLQQRPVVLASYGTTADMQEGRAEGEQSGQWHRQQLPLYLKQHAQQSGTGGAEGALPYARTASMEGR